MAIINNLSISYPDFQLNQIIDPDQFDINNAELVTKVNEIISKLNITTEVDIPQLTIGVVNTLQKNNTSPYNPTQSYHPATKKYIDDIIIGAIIGQLPENSVTDDMLSNMSGQIKSRVSYLTKQNSELRKVRSGKDLDGIFTIIEYKLGDGKTFKKSVLSGGVAPLYNTRTVTFYAEDGVSELSKTIYTVVYDEDGDFIDEYHTLPLFQ